MNLLIHRLYQAKLEAEQTKGKKWIKDRLQELIDRSHLDDDTLSPIIPNTPNPKHIPIEYLELSNPRAIRVLSALGVKTTEDIPNEETLLRHKNFGRRALNDIKEALSEHGLVLPTMKWTLEACQKEALKYTRRGDWAKNSPSYLKARKEGWLDQCTAHMTTPFKTIEACQKEALKYTLKSDWAKTSPRSYLKARKEGWLDQCTAHMTPPAFKWTLETCQKDALLHTTRMGWKKASPRLYEASQRHGWLDQCTAHMTPAFKWTLETCQKDALQFNSKKEWACNSTAYSRALREGWLDQCTAHMTPPAFKWTLETCQMEALKHPTRTAWARSSDGSYKAAIKKGWDRQCCSHMTKIRSGRPRASKP